MSINVHKHRNTKIVLYVVFRVIWRQLTVKLRKSFKGSDHFKVCERRNKMFKKFLRILKKQKKMAYMQLEQNVLQAASKDLNPFHNLLRFQHELFFCICTENRKAVLRILQYIFKQICAYVSNSWVYSTLWSTHLVGRMRKRYLIRKSWERKWGGAGSKERAASSRNLFIQAWNLRFFHLISLVLPGFNVEVLYISERHRFRVNPIKMGEKNYPINANHPSQCNSGHQSHIVQVTRSIDNNITQIFSYYRQ